MEVMVTGRHFEITEAIRNYALKRISRLDKHFDRLGKAELVLEREKERVKAELTIPAPRGNVLVARSSDRDLYAAVDQVAHRMERQIDRLKERLQDHRAERPREGVEPGT